MVLFLRQWQQTFDDDVASRLKRNGIVHQGAHFFELLFGHVVMRHIGRVFSHHIESLVHHEILRLNARHLGLIKGLIEAHHR